VSTPTEKIHMEWKTAENARTEQRMKHRSDDIKGIVARDWAGLQIVSLDG
jgi:hypothetical protein